MLIYGYVRQSSKEQVKWGYNLVEQERQIKEYCEYHYTDYDLKIYVDAGKSGTNMNRPQLKRLLNDCRKHSPNVVVFHNIDRLSRELNDLWSMIKFFINNKIEMVSVIGYIDLSTAYGKGNILNEGLSAMIESMKISDRTIRALKQGVYEGKYPFGNTPVGYKKVDKRLCLSDDPNEIALVKYIFNCVGNNECCIATLRNTVDTKFKKRLSEAAIIRIIKNPVYYGTMIYRGIEKTNYCEPIISKELYLIANKNIKIKKSKRTKTKYIFKNKCFCANCNSFMTHVAGTSKTKKLYAYYKCPNCFKSISQVRILDMSDDVLQELSVKYSKDIMGISANEEQIRKYKKQQTELIDNQKETPIDIDTFFELYNDITKKISNLEYINSNTKINYTSFKKLSYETKKYIADKFIKRIEVFFDKNKIRIIPNN